MPKFEVIIVPSFQEEINKIKDKKQLELILKSVKKIESLGKNSLKVLYVRDSYLLGEIKFKRPPYRLYVIAEQESEKFYAVRWEHKKEQEKVILQLKERLSHIFEIGIKNISDLFK